MFWSFLKFDSKRTLNKTKQSLSLNKAKSAFLTLLNKDSLSFSKITLCCIFFATNYILFQKCKKVEVFKVFKYF